MEMVKYIKRENTDQFDGAVTCFILTVRPGKQFIKLEYLIKQKWGIRKKKSLLRWKQMEPM